MPKKNSPAIIFIDDIDLIAAKREAARVEIEDRVTSQLLMLIDEAKTRGKTTIIGATSRINCIDPAFRRFGRFDRDIGLGIPDESDRMEILRIHTRDMKVSDDFDISELSKSTNGFVGADLEQLCAEAAMNCIREKLNLLNPAEGRIDSEILDGMAVTQSHFLSALKVVQPASQRGEINENSKVPWDNLDGLYEHLCMPREYNEANEEQDQEEEPY